LERLQDDVFGILKPAALKALVNQHLNFRSGDLNDHAASSSYSPLCPREGSVQNKEAYRDAETSRVAVLVRRRDGNFDLIED
jgi:hypothetical protein